MKTVKWSVICALLFSAANTFAHTVGIDAPASEKGDVCNDVAYGVIVCRNVVNIITGAFEARSISVSYSGRLATSNQVFAYVNVNGQEQTSQMNCAITGASRGSSGYMACTLAVTDGYQSHPALLRNAQSDQAWKVEMAFTDGLGNWDRNGEINYKTSFVAAQEDSHHSVYFDGNCVMTYQPNGNSLLVSCQTYVPKSHLLKVETGVFLGSKVNGKELPPVQMELDSQGQNYIAMLDVASVADGSLEIYFYDGANPATYDSNFGKNYVFNLMRRQ